MLPFPILVEYGNVVKNWYEGSLMAFDSSIFNSASFTDYRGNIIYVSDMNGATATAKVSSGVDMQYGKGFEVNFSLIGIKDSAVNVSWVQNSFTLDFWHRQKTTGYTYFAPMNCLSTFSGPWSSSPKFQYLNDIKFNSKFMIGTNPQYYQYTPYLPLNTTTWTHYCFMYNASSSTHTFYVNGVLTNTYSSVPVVATGIQSIGIAGDVYKDNYSNTPILERYRLTAGLKFNTAGFDITKIY